VQVKHRSDAISQNVEGNFALGRYRLCRSVAFVSVIGGKAAAPAMTRRDS